jgi:hypothetical protein
VVAVGGGLKPRIQVIAETHLEVFHDPGSIHWWILHLRSLIVHTQYTHVAAFAGAGIQTGGLGIRLRGRRSPSVTG